MTVDEGSQDFLRTCLEYGGEADTSTIRSETGLSRGKVNHRFNKLEEMGWIKIEKAEEGFGDREPPKIAVLTEDGKNAIKEGKAGNRVLEEPEENDSFSDINEEEFQKMNDSLQKLRNKVNVVIERVNNVETELENGSFSDSSGEESNKEGIEELGFESDDANDIAEEMNLEESVIRKEEFESLERDVNRLNETVDMISQSISKGSFSNDGSDEEKISEIESEVDEIREIAEDLKAEQKYLDEWLSTAEVHLKALRLFFDDHDIEFQSYVSEIQDS